MHTLQGSWLGLGPPDPGDQRTWCLDADDEFVMGSDGLFDQLAVAGRSGLRFVQLLDAPDRRGTLFESVYQVLLKKLAEYAQQDDITMIGVRRGEKQAAALSGPTIPAGRRSSPRARYGSAFQSARRVGPRGSRSGSSPRSPATSLGRYRQRHPRAYLPARQRPRNGRTSKAPWRSTPNFAR